MENKLFSIFLLLQKIYLLLFKVYQKYTWNIQWDMAGSKGPESLAGGYDQQSIPGKPTCELD